MRNFQKLVEYAVATPQKTKQEIADWEEFLDGMFCKQCDPSVGEVCERHEEGN